ncbi:hypothetical protein ACKWTF_015020 [Chironomus riparius]
MSKIDEIEFTLNEVEFLQRFEDVVSQNSMLDLLHVINIPTSSKGHQLISQNWFDSKICSHQQLIGIILRINGAIDDLPENLDLVSKPSILIAFQSTIGGHESKTYWKTAGRDKFYSLYIDDDDTDDVTSFCHAFLIDEIKNGRTGIPQYFQQKSKFHLQDIVDNDRRNLLVLATCKRQQNVVERLLNHDFVADDAIDKAWELYIEIVNDDEQKQTINNIIMNLLRSNSRYPSDFEYEKASKEVKEFVDKCESLHEDVDEDDFDALKLKIDSYPNLIHFYSRDSESLLAYSLRMRKFKIFDLLAKGITIGTHEDLDEVYENMYIQECRKLREQHKINAKEFPETHIFILRSKSRIGNNDKLSHKNWKFIDEAFEVLNKNDFIRKILKVAAEFKKLKIYFDFKHDSTYYLDPATSIYSKGIIYEGGSIFIGAKHLIDDERKFAVFGVLAHELCHLAVFMAFMNRNFDPFPVGESVIGTRFKEQVMVQCKEREEAERIVANVFSSYAEDVQDSEMIVTVPQMLMHYVNDSAKIEELEGTFEELFKYCREVVEPELDKALPVLKQLGDDEKVIKFADLTNPMKAKVLHSKLIFQGSLTTFNDLIGDDEEALKLLESEDIQDILLRNVRLEFGEICQLNLKYGLTERFFVDRKISSELKNSFFPEEFEKNKKTIEQVRENMEKSKIFILADHAGTGKTTIFKNCALKLKQSLPNFWISFVNLRKCAKIFEKMSSDELNSDKVLQMLVKIVNPDSKLEQKIFTKLFAASKVVLLFDGVDEICPKFTTILAKIFKILMDSDVKNEFWISTRPHYASKLEAFFQTSSFTFALCTADEEEKIIKKILTVNKIPEDKLLEFSRKVQLCIQHRLESYRETMDNPMMIQMITELYILDETIVSLNYHYKLYELMIEKQRKELGEKIPIEDHDKDSKLTVWDVHRILALELIIGDKFKLKNLSIIRKWKKEKKNWTSDMIQRYGFVIVDLKDENLDTSIDFMHRTWAEFFVAQFLMKFIFNDDDDNFSAEDIKILVNIFDAAMNDSSALIKVQEFIHSFLINEAKSYKINKKVKKVILKKISKLQKDAKEGLKSYALMGCIDADIFCKFWKFDQKINLLEELVIETQVNILYDILESNELSMYPNWHETFNKSGTKLITDETIEKFEGIVENEWQWNADKNLLKFYDFVDKNFNFEVRKKIYVNFRLKLGRNSKIQIQIILKYQSCLNAFEFMDMCLIHLDYYYLTFEALTLIYGIIEKFFNFDHESLNCFLFHYPHAVIPGVPNFTAPPIEWSSPIVLAFESKNPKIHVFVKDFFMKYKKSVTELQNLILNSSFNNLVDPVNSLFYSDYKQLFEDVFGADKTKLAEKIENYVNNEAKGSYVKRNDQHLKDFMLFIFSDDEKADEMFKKINWINKS